MKKATVASILTFLAPLALVSFLPVLTFAGTAYVWQQRSIPNPLYSVALVGDGTEVIGGAAANSSSGDYIYTSTNGGATWTARTGSGQHFWVAIVASTDGSKIAALDGTWPTYTLYISTNGGTTWTPNSVSGVQDPGRTGIAMSSSGTEIAVAETGTTYSFTPPGGGYIYISTNDGASWAPATAAGQHYWYSVAMSANGNDLIAADGGDGYLYLSTNGGASWTPLAGAGQHYWYSVAMSADGSKIVAADYGQGYGGYLYVSTNGGSSWTAETSLGQRDWDSVAISSDGSTIAATSYGTNPNYAGDYVYVSNNSGSTWTAESPPGIVSWWGKQVAVSPGGSVIAGGGGGYLWIRSIPPTCSVTLSPNPSAYAYSGTPVTLFWSSSNATEVYINDVGWVNPSGSTSVASLTSTRVSGTLCKEVSVSLPRTGDSHDDQFDDYTGTTGSTSC